MVVRCLFLLSASVFFAGEGQDNAVKMKKSFYPTQVGTKWVYQQETEEYTQVITAVEEKAGQKVVTIGNVQENGKVKNYSTVGVSEKGVFRLGQGKERFDPPIKILQFPLTPGDKWEYQQQVPIFPSRLVKITVRDFEEVEVPAGKYRALRVDHEGAGKDYPQQSYWYAEGVGKIKWTIAGKQTSVVKPFVLKSFTPGKE